MSFYVTLHMYSTYFYIMGKRMDFEVYFKPEKPCSSPRKECPTGFCRTPRGLQNIRTAESRRWHNLACIILLHDEMSQYHRR